MITITVGPIRAVDYDYSRDNRRRDYYDYSRYIGQGLRLRDRAGLTYI